MTITDLPIEERGQTSELPPAPPNSRRWWALGIIALAQLMVVLDATIITIALPYAQADLHISDASRQWAMTAYTLMFGLSLIHI